MSKTRDRAKKPRSTSEDVIIRAPVSTVTLRAAPIEMEEGEVTCSPCDGSPELLTVENTPKRVFSPGYPDHYENNLRCEWVLQSTVNHSTGFGIQLTTLELHFDAPYSLKPDKCNDSMEIFEGTPSNPGHSLGKWCGKTKHVIKTMSDTITLRFLTDAYYVGRGFVIEYSLVRVASAECQPGEVTPVHVGRAPLYETFDVINVEDRCTWTMEAIDESGNSDPNSALVIEAFSVPYVLCDVGHFTVYDGQDTSSRIVLEWCDRGQAFSKIYLSSNYATLTFFFNVDKNLTSKVDAIQLKLYTRDAFYACNDTYLPSITVGLDPVYFSVPFATSPSGFVCDVHVTQHVKNTVHVEVISVNGHETTCETEAVIVSQVLTDAEVMRLCNRRRYPMYLPHKHDLIVGGLNDNNKVYLRAITDDHFCGGWDFEGKAYDDLIREEELPRSSDSRGVPHNCYHRYLVKTEKINRIISLHLVWSANVFQGNVSTETDTCQGDFISVYDGVNETAPLLFSTCRKSNMTHSSVNARIIGTEHEMLVIYNTDGANEARRATIQFYALPVNGRDCEHIHEIKVNRSIQAITSPNYPDFYPLDYMCTYILKADAADVIVLQPVDTKFTAGCGDIINMFEGKYISPDNVFGRICGHERLTKQFVSQTHEMAIQFKSDKFGSSGGWKLWAFTRPRRSKGDKPSISFTLAALVLLIVSYSNIDLGIP